MLEGRAPGRVAISNGCLKEDSLWDDLREKSGGNGTAAPRRPSRRLGALSMFEEQQEAMRVEQGGPGASRQWLAGSQRQGGRPYGVLLRTCASLCTRQSIPGVQVEGEMIQMTFQSMWWMLRKSCEGSTVEKKRRLVPDCFNNANEQWW